MRLRILVVLALLLNAAAGSAAAVPDAMPETLDHAADCCSQPACDCDCAIPQAMTVPVFLSQAFRRTALPLSGFLVQSVHSSALPALFRPPA
jgi:hypothetical protein